MQVLFSPAILLPVGRFNRIFHHPSLRPPIPSEMEDDVHRLARNIASLRSDQSCPQLNAEDLVQEQMIRWSILVTSGRIESIPNRAEAFSFLKTAFNNLVKSLVGRHRMTLKRGAKRDHSADVNVSDTGVEHRAFIKNSEVSSDDIESGVQLSDPSGEWRAAENFIADVSPLLTPIERLILNEFANPGKETLFYAELAAAEKSTRLQTFTITEACYSSGLGLDRGEYRRYLAQLRTKLQKFRAMTVTEKEIARNRNLAVVEDALDLELPRSLDPKVMLRALTLAAADNMQVLLEAKEIADALTDLGVTIPRMSGSRVDCFGIRPNKNTRPCNVCSITDACETQADTAGLKGITIDPRLLGAKVPAVPTLVSTHGVPAPILVPEDEPVYAALMDSFIPAGGSATEIRFKIEASSRQPDVVVKTGGKFDIVLKNPPEGVRTWLVLIGNEWHIPAGANATEVIDILNEFAKQTILA